MSTRNSFLVCLALTSTLFANLITNAAPRAVLAAPAAAALQSSPPPALQTPSCPAGDQAEKPCPIAPPILVKMEITCISQLDSELEPCNLRTSLSLPPTEEFQS